MTVFRPTTRSDRDCGVSVKNRREPPGMNAGLLLLPPVNLTLESAMSQLEKYGPIHLHLGLKMLQAAGAAGYPLDLLAVAAINRSANLHSGFTLLMEKKNFLAAAPLLRLQLDNCLRFYAAFLVSKPHEFALTVYDGTPIRKLKSRDGKLMTDAYLVGELSKLHPWMTHVYGHASGYIHLSEKHFFDAISKKDGVENVLSLKIGPGSEHIPDSAYAEVIHTFSEATKVFLSLIHQWTETKNGNTQTSDEA